MQLLYVNHYVEFTIKTIEYLKDRYEEELDRFSHFETKCSQFLKFLTAIIGATLIITRLIHEKIFALSTELDWCLFIVYILMVICIVCSWGHALLALKISDSPVLPRSKAVSDYMLQVDDDDREEYITNCYIYTLEELASAIQDKAKNLEHSYNELVFSACFFFLFTIILAIMEFTK